MTVALGDGGHRVALRFLFWRLPGLAVLVLGALACGFASAEDLRVELSLDGTWSVAESVGAEEIPAQFGHSAPVPGLTRQAQPPFPDVDRYETHDYLYTMAHWGVRPARERIEGLARTPQKRNFFWYHRRFTPPVRRQQAVLVVEKAQFGTAVWLNGQKLGEHLGCFTAGRFDATKAMNWHGENHLLVRIGAHPGALPQGAFWGSDGEKAVWTPGIYDRVRLILSDNPRIDWVQVAPRIAQSQILVESRLVNQGPACTVQLTHQVRTLAGDRQVGLPVSDKIALGPGESTTVLQTVTVPDAVLWCPENPFLYVLHSECGSDRCRTRFGMREFRADPATGRAMLNGKPVYLRGASITLHRFFGDPQCDGLPWDEAWLRRFLVDIPRRLHWNAFRLCIGPAPQRWLDLADEAGLLLQYEFPIWSDRPPMWFTLWKQDEIIAQLQEFVRDNWNHPSVVIWDASNETRWPFLGEKAIPAVRGLDLSDRPWDNGYNKPLRPEDFCEHHPYLMRTQPPFFEMTELERLFGDPKPRAPFLPPFPNPAIINEYDWLWLHRDGRPTHLSRPVFEHLVGPAATADQRRQAAAYLLGGLTEFWRAWRKYAGVMYLAYLDADLPDCFTCDNFRDVRRLELDPWFLQFMEQAFKPLGVYVNFWQPQVSAGAERHFTVVLTNDTYQAIQGTLELAWQAPDGPKGPKTRVLFEVLPLGQVVRKVPLPAPSEVGSYQLVASAEAPSMPWSPTICRRDVRVVPAGK